MTRVTRGSLAAFVFLLAATAGAQPRWSRERPPETGACFYEDANYQGRYFCMRPGERVGTLPAAMTDRIASVRLIGGAEITIFRDSELRGRSARFLTSVRDLRREGWRGQISSLEVVTSYARRDGYYARAPEGGGVRGR